MQIDKLTVMNKRILIIEDDPVLVDLVRIHLHDLPATLLTASSGRDGLVKLAECPVDLCILDVMLPDLNGLDVCRLIRQRDALLPILMLTSKSDESDKVLGFEAGADDYLTKPFGVQEFTARLRALLRRAGQPALPAEPAVYSCQGLTIDRHQRRVLVNGQRIELTPKEFDLLVLLVGHPGKTYSRKELLHQVWNYSFEGYEHTVTAHVNRLRSKIEPDFAHPVHILTTWGVGYRFAESSLEPTA